MPDQKPSTSAALASVFAQGKMPDEDLYRDLPETDKQILISYLEGVDQNGKAYFSRSEKLNFLKKWKTKNFIHTEGEQDLLDGGPEQVVDEAQPNVMPAYSLSPFSDKKRDPNTLELERLLSMIKNERLRNQITREADVWSSKSGQPAFKYVEKYLVNGGQVKENLQQEALILELNQINKTLDESFLRMFGGMIEKLLQRMFGSSTVPVKVRGTQGQVNALQDTLANEKRYMDVLQQYGKDSPHTYRNKSSLEQSVSKFERVTGIKWPFKDKK